MTTTIAGIIVAPQNILMEILATILPTVSVAQLIAPSASTRGLRTHFCQTLGMMQMLLADARLRMDRTTMKILVTTVAPQNILMETLATI